MVLKVKLVVGQNSVVRSIHGFGAQGLVRRVLIGVPNTNKEVSACTAWYNFAKSCAASQIAICIAVFHHDP